METQKIKLMGKDLNPRLVSYITSNILPIYEHVDKGHDIRHIEQVVERSMNFGYYCHNNHAEPVTRLDANFTKNGCIIDFDIVFTVACCHDIGLATAPREVHEKESARLVREDKFLNEYFGQDINIVADAIEDHRASKGENPRTIYGYIVSQADRCFSDFKTYVIRTYEFRKDNLSSIKAIADDARAHLTEKFGIDGYAYKSAWLPDADLTAFRQDALRFLNQSDEDYYKSFQAIVDEYESNK
jgi:HD domain.